jgi:hypothetical protein
MDTLSHHYLDKLKHSHPALRLLNADHAPLIISFFYRIFIQPNRRSIAYAELVTKLDDYLYQLQEMYGENKYPRGARAYIEEWSSDNSEFLRQYYPPHRDDPELDLTPAVEKAIEWLLSLEQKQFIGAESRLLSLFHLLRDIVQTTEQDPAVRIAELTRQKALLDQEIEKIQTNIASQYDTRQIKERFLQAEETARKLLSDFRQVEHNFRQLDRQAREHIATSEERKGQLLDIIFHEHDIIHDSDQGKSFKAFWEFLMSPSSQDELKKMLQATLNLTEVKELIQHPLLDNIDIALLTAGEKVYRTSILLAEQLRKYLEDQAYLENRRIMEIIKNIEKKAITLKAASIKTKAFSVLADTAPHIELLMSRILFTPPKNPVITVTDLAAGQTRVSINLLYEQVYVDENALLANIRQALQTHSQISLQQLLALFPLQKGMEELITYFHLASKESHAIINNEIQEHFVFANKAIQMPQVIFVRH